MDVKKPPLKRTVKFCWTGEGSKIRAEVKCGTDVRAVTFINNRLTPQQLIEALEHLNDAEEKDSFTVSRETLDDDSAKHSGKTESAGEVQFETRTEEEASEA